MRAVTAKVVRAFLNGAQLKLGNTMSTGNTLRLFENIIAMRDEHGDIFICDGGWKTPTTMERLNGLLTMMYAPKRIRQDMGKWYLGDEDFYGWMKV